MTTHPDPHTPMPTALAPPQPIVKPTFKLSERARRSGAQPISELMALAVGNPDLISLAAGLVDYDALPMRAAADLLADLLSQAKPAKIALQYGSTAGHAGLRQALLEHLAALDHVTPDAFGACADDIVVTTGSQQLLFMLTDVLVDPGDIVITAWPSYFVYTGALPTFGADVRCVDIDDQGMIPAKLRDLLDQIEQAGDLPRVKILYLVDYHQNPTGITLSQQRRYEIFDIIRDYSEKAAADSEQPGGGGRILILEDAAYRELTFTGQTPPSIKSLDSENQYVALTQTFSKPFAPGVRTGYALLPTDLVQPVVNQKGAHDFGSANLNQHLLLQALQTGRYHAHVRELCQAYAAKCQAMLDALDQHLGDLPGAAWTRPTGGLYVYLTLPPHINTDPGNPLFEQALAQGVIYVPGSYCYAKDNSRKIPRNEIRLSFGVPTIPQIQEGIKRLAEVVRMTNE